jgi:ferredoxin--NADP+ reductase
MAQDDAHRGRLTGRREIAPGLALIRVAADRPFVFEPGQYATLGLAQPDSTLIQRPMSIASSADDVSEYEFFVRLVSGGDFTPVLWRQRLGDPVRITGPKGRFLLQNDGRTCVFVASGTGLAPFMSMIRTLNARGQGRDIVLVHGVSREADLAWREELERTAAQPSSSLHYVPTVSRPQECPDWKGLTGRAEDVLAGQLDRYGLGPANTTIYACGHPQMIETVTTLAMARGFPKEQIRRELYWAKETGTRT